MDTKIRWSGNFTIVRWNSLVWLHGFLNIQHVCQKQRYPQLNPRYISTPAVAYLNTLLIAGGILIVQLRFF